MTGNPILVRLSDEGQAVADPADDLRGRVVRDRFDEEIGRVTDLLIDSSEHKVRMLRVEHGGFLGIGASASFVPVEAIAAVEDTTVRIDQTRERMAGAPIYDPDVIDEPSAYTELYGYYGYPPFWGPW